jgi:hypothetical protein
MSAKRMNESGVRVTKMTGETASAERPGLCEHSHTPGRSGRRSQLRNACLRSSLLVICALLLPGTGCSWWRSITGNKTETPDAEVATTRPATTQISRRDVTSLPPNLPPPNQPVVTGKLPGPVPLVYLAVADGTLRVRNVDTDEEIIRFDTKAGQIARVDNTGVYLANKPVIGANLAAGTYAIEIVAPNAGIQSTQQRNVLQSQ